MKTCKRVDLRRSDRLGFCECGKPAIVEYHWAFPELHGEFNAFSPDVTPFPAIEGTTPMCQEHYIEAMEDTLPSPSNLVPEPERWRKL